MSPSDWTWTGLAIALGVLLLPLAVIWWRFGDPDRDDRITAANVSPDAVLAVVSFLNAIQAGRHDDWIWFALSLLLAALFAVRWYRGSSRNPADR